MMVIGGGFGKFAVYSKLPHRKTEAVGLSSDECVCEQSHCGGGARGTWRRLGEELSCRTQKHSETMQRKTHIYKALSAADHIKLLWRGDWSNTKNWKWVWWVTIDESFYLSTQRMIREWQENGSTETSQPKWMNHSVVLKVGGACVPHVDFSRTLRATDSVIQTLPNSLCRVTHFTNEWRVSSLLLRVWRLAGNISATPAKWSSGAFHVAVNGFKTTKNQSGSFVPALTGWFTWVQNRVGQNLWVFNEVKIWVALLLLCLTSVLSFSLPGVCFPFHGIKVPQFIPLGWHFQLQITNTETKDFLCRVLLCTVKGWPP